jgi:hypothetical protein
MPVKKKSVWDMADDFAYKNGRAAFRAMEKDKYALHEYLRFAFMKGYDRARRTRKNC